MRHLTFDGRETTASIVTAATCALGFIYPLITKMKKKPCKATALTDSAPFQGYCLWGAAWRLLGQKAAVWGCSEELKKALRNWRCSGEKAVYPATSQHFFQYCLSLS